MSIEKTKEIDGLRYFLLFSYNAGIDCYMKEAASFIDVSVKEFGCLFGIHKVANLEDLTLDKLVNQLWVY